MRVLVLNNPHASGSGRLPKAVLIRALERAGHDVRYRSIRKPGWKRKLNRTKRVVVVVGGDGTVAQIAAALAKRDGSAPPLVVIPAGKSNNIARALGLPTTLDDIVRGLDSDRQTRLALGVARGPWGKAPFVESAGIGPFASLLNAVIPRQHAAIAYLRRAFLAASPRAMDVRADGEDLSGEYLAAHVLNIGAIGPRLELARDADPTDEWLDLLLITERDRSAVAAYFAARAAGKQALCPIATHRARRIHIRSWPARDDGYVDDAPWPDERRPQTGAVRIKVEARIAVLLP